MEYVSVVIQIIIALGIFNVWLLRSEKATEWRGGNATSMKEEFAVYGLPPWSMYVVGGLKLLLAAALLAGIWLPVLVKPAALGMAVLMVGAAALHVKVSDPWKKALPALSMLVLSVILLLL